MSTTIKMKKISIVSLIMLTACSLLPMDRYYIWYRPTNFINIYFDNVYISNIQARFDKKKTVSFCQGKCSEYGESENVSFYQDENKDCLLFTILNDDIANMEREFIKVNKNQDYVFVIEKNTIRIMSQTEYEKIKPTLVPHKFDSSLCK